MIKYYIITKSDSFETITIYPKYYTFNYCLN